MEKAVQLVGTVGAVTIQILTYEKAMEVSDYFKENLQNNHFVNPDQTVYIGLGFRLGLYE